MVSIRFVIPKGSLENETYRVLESAGYVLSGQDRTYRPSINDPEIDLKIMRPQEIPYLVADGTHDLGITGEDWVKETGVDVASLLKLGYGRIRMVMALPKVWTDINSFSDLLSTFWSQGRNVRISTEYLNITSEYVKKCRTYVELFGERDPLVVTPWLRKGDNPWVTVMLSFGATEAKPPENADAIVDVSQTGTTLERNDLKVVETVLESEAVLIANKGALGDPAKSEKIYDVLTLLHGVVEGRGKLHIFVNVEAKNLGNLVANLPALKGPTISPLSKEGWYSVNTVIDRKDFLKVLPMLRKLAQGLVVHEPRQIITLEEAK
ncbi:MAG: ATP phosphoribosyltransferase [Candidatus Bathyarchaeia archaeon]